MSKKPTFEELITICKRNTEKAKAIFDADPNKASALAVEGSIYLLKASKIALEQAKAKDDSNTNV